MNHRVEISEGVLAESCSAKDDFPPAAEEKSAEESPSRPGKLIQVSGKPSGHYPSAYRRELEGRVVSCGCSSHGEHGRVILRQGQRLLLLALLL